MKLCSALLCALCLAGGIAANVEKVIFVAPPALAKQEIHSGVNDLDIAYLSPARESIRLRIPIAFPNSPHAKGLQSWYLLDDLRPGGRYEVRVCWAAIQPTSFWLYTHATADVFGNPELLSDLISFSQDRRKGGRSSPEDRATPIQSNGDQPATLLLQVFAAADYFTSNRTLMQEPPPVLIDLILDPYVLNVFPKSLGPTAIYVSIVAVISWYVAGLIWRWLVELSGVDEKPHKE